MKIGAEVLGTGNVRFRVWAPACQAVEAYFRSQRGTCSGARRLLLSQRPHVRAGTCYRYRLNHGDAFPDPASRFNQRGPRPVAGD